MKIWNIIVLALLPLSVEAGSEDLLPRGVYKNTDFGPVEIDCWEGHSICLGRYGHETANAPKGGLFLFRKGRTLTGHWVQEDSDRPCAQTYYFPGGRTQSWGSVEFQFDEHANNWTGAWSYCDAEPTSAWNGARGEEPEKTLCTGGGPDGPFQVLARPEDGNLDHVELDIDAFELGRQTYQLTCDADERCTTSLNGGMNKLTFQFYPSFKDAASASLFLFTTVDHGVTMKDAILYIDQCAPAR